MLRLCWFPTLPHLPDTQPPLMTRKGGLGSTATGSVCNKPRQEAPFKLQSSHPTGGIICVCVCENLRQNMFNFLAIGHAGL